MDKKTLEICEKLLLSRIQHLDEIQRTTSKEFSFNVGLVKASYEIALCDIKLTLEDYD